MLYRSTSESNRWRGNWVMRWRVHEMDDDMEQRWDGGWDWRWEGGFMRWMMTQRWDGGWDGKWDGEWDWRWHNNNNNNNLLHPISPVSSHRSVQSLDVRNFVLRRRACYLCRGHTLWQLVLGLSLYPPPLLGTDFRWIFVIPAIVFSLSGKNWRLICSMRLFKPIYYFFN